MKPTFLLSKTTNKFAAEKAEKEARNKKAADEAAHVLQTFVESFDNGSSSGGRGATWIRGGVEGSALDRQAASATSGSLYKMEAKASTKSSTLAVMFADDAPTPAEKPSANVHLVDAGPVHSAANKRREMDALLEELKGSQEREGAGQPRHGMGSVATPLEMDTSCNIAVRNLSPSVTEEVLASLFGKHGKIASVKVMWPRTDEERGRGRNTGFVLFHKRADAESAMNSLQDRDIEGGRVTLAWAKSVRPTPNAQGGNAYLPPAGVGALDGAMGGAGAGISPLHAVASLLSASAFPESSSNSHVRIVSGTSECQHRETRFKTVSVLGKLRSVPTGWDARLPPPASSLMSLFVVPTIPSDATEVNTVVVPRRDDKALADLWAQYLQTDGPAMEASLSSVYNDSAHGMADSSLRLPWLDDPDGTVAVYLRWRAWATSQGDTSRQWRTAPFQMVAGGPWWKPPACPLQEDLEEDEARDLRAFAHVESDTQDSRSTRNRQHLSANSSSKVPGREDKSKLALVHQAEWGALLGFNTERAREGVPDTPGPERDSSGDEGEGGVEGTRRERTLTLSNRDVRAAMVFALDHADAAPSVVNVLVRALCDQGASAPLTVARLYVAADILAASAVASVRNASAYRSALQTVLPDAFEAIGARLRLSSSGRLSREALRERVLRVLAAWDRSFVFTALYITGLEATLLRPHAINCESEYSVESSERRDERGATEAAAADDSARRCRLAGLSCLGGNAAMLARLAWVNEHVKLKMGLGAMGGSSLQDDLAALVKTAGEDPVPGSDGTILSAEAMAASDTGAGASKTGGQHEQAMPHHARKKRRVGPVTDVTESERGQWEDVPETETEPEPAQGPVVAPFPGQLPVPAGYGMLPPPPLGWWPGAPGLPPPFPFLPSPSPYQLPYGAPAPHVQHLGPSHRWHVEAGTEPFFGLPRDIPAQPLLMQTSGAEAALAPVPSAHGLLSAAILGAVQPTQVQPRDRRGSRWDMVKER